MSKTGNSVIAALNAARHEEKPRPIREVYVERLLASDGSDQAMLNWLEKVAHLCDEIDGLVAFASQLDDTIDIYLPRPRGQCLEWHIDPSDTCDLHLRIEDHIRQDIVKSSGSSWRYYYP